MSSYLSKEMVRSSLFIIIGAILCITIITIIIGYQFYVPLNSSSSYKIINITDGMNVRSIAHLLKTEQIIRSELAFEILVRIIDAEDKLKLGRYRLSSSMNLIEIVKIIEEGKAEMECVTIPEGYNIWQIADLLEKRGIISNREEFIELANDKEFIIKFKIDAESLEGYLFPETYCIHSGLSLERIVEMMVEEFNKRVYTNEEYHHQARLLGLSFHEVITLASIIEKETAVKEERALISAVFHNRLKKGMRLDSDPTTIYALGEKFDGNLKREHLKIDSKYNTYRYKGLPPGPIANPGIDSIKAALYPAEVDYLYFVSMNNGKHKFTSTLSEHKKYVIKYQIEPYRR